MDSAKITIKRGTPFNQAMRKINEEAPKPIKINIEGVDYDLNWFRGVEVTRSNSDWHGGFMEQDQSEQIQLALNQLNQPSQKVPKPSPSKGNGISREGDSNRNKGATQSAQIPVTPKKQIQVDFHESSPLQPNPKAPTELPSPKPEIEIPCEQSDQILGSPVKQAQASSRDEKLAQLKLHVIDDCLARIERFETVSISVDPALYSIPKRLSCRCLGTDLEMPIQKVKAGMAELDRLRSAANEMSATVITKEEKKLNGFKESLKGFKENPSSFTTSELDYIFNNIDIDAFNNIDIASKDLEQYIKLINEGRQMYVKICEGYLTQSKSTVHLDLATQYLKNLSEFAASFKPSLGPKGFQTLVKKHQPHTDAFKFGERQKIDNHLNAFMSSKDRAALVNKLGNHLTRANEIKEIEKKKNHSK